HSPRPPVHPAHSPYSSFVNLHSSLQESEIKSVDVRLVEDERLPEQHLICLHFDGAEPPRTEAGLSDGQLARGKSEPCVDGEVSEIERIPEYDTVDDTGFDERLAHVRERQAQHFHV